MKASYYLAAQNFVAPSVNENEIHQKSFRQDDNNEILCANNIMFDSRVCRGNTYATPVLTEDQRRHHEFYERTQKARRSLIQKRKKENAKRPITPPPVEGRVHVSIQTDGTVEEIFGSNNIEIIHDESNEILKEDVSQEEQIGSPDNNNVFTEDTSKENDDPITKKLSSPYEYLDIKLDESVEAQHTNNLARAIYDEAKNDALSRINQGEIYHSDPERY